MLAIEVELLGGRYVATEHNDRSRAEWPPHPARFYSALVAALHDHDPVDPAERAALLWLEQQPAPHLDVDLCVDKRVGRRQVHSVFVPVNDVTLVGDPEGDVREARAKLAALNQREQTKQVSAEVKKARKEVDNQEAKLAAFIGAQQIVDPSPNASAMRTAVALLPERRTRIDRTFPVVIPTRATFVFFWPDAKPEVHAEALRRLCDRVTRLGHSSSLVRCTLVERAIEPSLVPRSVGEHVLRVVGPGQLERLEDAYARHQAVDARVLPARPQRYGEPYTAEPEGPRSVFGDEWIVFERIGGHRPLGSRGSDLAVALRRTMVEVNGKENLPPVLSGHAASGERTSEAHIAFVPLPWVGDEHADGSVQGLALIAPRSIAPGEREVLLRLLARWERERGDEDDDYAVDLGTPSDCGRPLLVRFRRVEVPAKAALSTARWCRPSRRFVTATPIALDRHPGNLRSNVERSAHKAAAEAETSIADACERIDLPRPISVSVSSAPLLTGSQHVRQFAPWPPQPGKTRRALVHADIVFPKEVRGPVLIGAGRYFGLGLSLPITERGDEGPEEETS
jgi:CRISPR-associated protein Csb2